MSSPVGDPEKVKCLEDQEKDLVCNNQEQVKECKGDSSGSKSNDDLTPQTAGSEGVEGDNVNIVADDSQNDTLKANSDLVSEVENVLKGVESCNFNWEGFEVVDELEDNNKALPAADRSPRKSNVRHVKEKRRSKQTARSQLYFLKGVRRHRYENSGRHRDTHRYSDKKSECGESKNKEKYRKESKQGSSKENHSDEITSETKLQSLDYEVDQDQEDEPHRKEREWKEERNTRVGETQNFKVKKAREGKQKHDGDGLSSTKEKSRTKKIMKKVSCRSSWKNFKKVLLVCDSRIQLDEPSLKESCSINIQVLSKPFLTFDDIPALVSDCIGQSSQESTLLICSVGTYDLIKLQDSENCKELLHEPFKYICIRSKDGEDPTMDIIKKAKDLKKTLQHLLGTESEVYFTSILPFSFRVYQQFQITNHKNATEHDTHNDVSESDLNDWEQKVHRDINLFNEYHLKTYPLRLSLQLANLSQCLVKELKNFFETCTVDGLNFREEVSSEITTNLGKTVNRYCTDRGKYEKVVLVGDSRLDHVRRAWPADIRYNCKFLTYPDLNLRHLCDPSNQVVKELSHSKNSLIVLCVGLYDLCSLAAHPECRSHPEKMLEMLVPSFVFYPRGKSEDVKTGMCNLMMCSAKTLRSITNNCDVIFSTIYDFDLYAHQIHMLSKHEKEVHHIVKKPTLKLASQFYFRHRNMVRAVALFNIISVVYSQKNSLPVWNVLTVVSDQMLINGRYSPISHEVLFDGIHPSPVVAERIAEKYRVLADEALMIESSTEDIRSESLDAIVNACKKNMRYLQILNSHQWSQWYSDEGQDKDVDTLASNQQFNSSLKLACRRFYQASTLVMPEREGSCQSPSALLSEISYSDLSGPLDDAASTSSFTGKRRRRSKSQSSSKQRHARQIPVRGSHTSAKHPEEGLPHLMGRSLWTDRYPRSPSPVHGGSYRRLLSSSRRSRSRSVSPSKHHATYMQSISYTAQKGYSRSPSPFERGRTHQTPYYARRKHFLRSPSISGRSYASVSPSRRSPSPDNVKHWRFYSKNCREGKALATLRDVHNQECAVYRKHPLAHPDYDKEYRLFKSKKLQCIFDLGGDPNAYDMSKDWQLFWPTRLEQLLEESWIIKKEKCLALIRSEPTQPKRKKRKSSSEVSTSKEKRSKKESKSSRKAKDHKSSTKSPEVKKRNGAEDSDKYPNDVKNDGDSELGGTVSEHSGYEEEIPKHDEENQFGRINLDEVAVVSISPEQYEVKNSPSIDGKSTNYPELDKSEFGTNNMKLCEGSLSNRGPSKISPQQLLKISGSSLMSGSLDSMEMGKGRSTALNPENNINKWRNQDPENSPMQSSSKDEAADEVSSTTPSFEDVKHDFIGVLEILNRMGEKLGILKLPLKGVFDKALKYQSMGLQPSELLKVNDTMTLFVMINKKLEVMANEANLNIITKVVLQEANQRLSKILKALEPELDISQIAQKCLGKNQSDTVSYIQSQFLEQGISEPTNDQLKEVYEAVRQERSRLLTQILKQTSIGSSSLHNQSSNSSSAAAPTSEDAKYSPTQAGWSDDDSREACLSQSRSRLVVSKDDHSCTEASNGVPHFPVSIEGISSASQLLVQPTKQIDVSSSSNPFSKQEPVVNTQLSAALSRLNRNVYDSLSENYVGDKSAKMRTVLSSTLDYGLTSPSTSKEQFSQPFESYSSPVGRSYPSKPVLTTSQCKTPGESSVSRKDPIRLVIPKGKNQGQNFGLPNPVMDDSGWQ